MTNSAIKPHVAACEVEVDGAKLDPKFAELLREVKVIDSLTLPDVAHIRIDDTKGENIDTHPLKLGSKLKIKMAAETDAELTLVFSGQIAAVEPEFTPTSVTIAVRAYDDSHKLNRERKTRTFQQMSASDMVKKVAQEARLQVDAEASSVVHAFFQQSNETDWDFAWRLAMMEDFEVVFATPPSGGPGKLQFRKAGKGAGSPTKLTWGVELINFRPRMSGIQQVNAVEVRGWDPKAKAVVNGSASSPTTSAKPGVTRAAVANDLGGGTTAVKDRSVTSTGEANALAKATLQRMAEAFYEADGVAAGNPKIKAGSKVKIDGVGQKFGGEFVVSSSTHSYRGTTGYQTQFHIAGRSARTLTELIRPPQERNWSASLVVGVVTNNKDPEKRGRVRVKYPTLSDKEESAWAPVATMSSGKERGMLMLPVVNEEVVVGFEHGDARRPIVLGSTFNGKDVPGAELEQNNDGSLGVVSNEKIHMHSKKDFEIKSDQKMLIEITSDETTKTKGNHTHEVTGSSTQKMKSLSVDANTTVEVKGGQSVTVKGMNVTVEATGSLTLKGMTVDIQGQTAVNVKGALINLG
jgi:phage protein D